MDRWRTWTEIEPRPKFILHKMQEVLEEESQKAGFLCSLIQRERKNTKREISGSASVSERCLNHILWQCFRLTPVFGVSKWLTWASQHWANWLLSIPVSYLHSKCRDCKHLPYHYPLQIPLPELNFAAGKSLFWASEKVYQCSTPW